MQTRMSASHTLESTLVREASKRLVSVRGYKGVRVTSKDRTQRSLPLSIRFDCNLPILISATRLGRSL